MPRHCHVMVPIMVQMSHATSLPRHGVHHGAGESCVMPLHATSLTRLSPSQQFNPHPAPSNPSQQFNPTSTLRSRHVTPRHATSLTRLHTALSQHLNPEFKDVCNNASWALGEIAMRVPEALRPGIGHIITPLIHVLVLQVSDNVTNDISPLILLRLALVSCPTSR